MSRINLPFGYLTALAEAHVTWFALLQLDLDSGTQYLASTPFDVPYGGNTYVGAQGIGTIDPVTETADGAQGLAFTLSGVPVWAIASVLTEPLQGRAVTLRVAVVTGAGAIVDPVVWQGALDVPVIEDDGATATVRITAEHALLGWQTPSGRLFSNEQQQLDYSGDKFFEFASDLADATIVWPGKEFFKQ